ncbi:MAG: phosphoribosylformimino-5-aminoimidazole carboxamide ribotide isomerase [Opitutaceae bacterium]
MTLFRPCIDLHEGKVKQIVGGSLRDDGSSPVTNFESDRSGAYFAGSYRSDRLLGGHVIKLGPGNDDAAKACLQAYPNGLQIGGGVCLENASTWLALGASHVIVTSWLFDSDGHFLAERLEALVREVGKERLVIDLSCRSVPEGWVVAMNRWQQPTDLFLSSQSLNELSNSCAEFLVHAADVEGKCEGIDSDLVRFLGESCEIPVTYAGGVHGFEDLETVNRLSRGSVDLTIGSALDIFGGLKVKYQDCVTWNQKASS